MSRSRPRPSSASIAARGGARASIAALLARRAPFTEIDRVRATIEAADRQRERQKWQRT